MFSQCLAGPVSRFLAWLIDGACLVLGLYLLGMVLAVFRLVSGDLQQALTIVLYFAFSFGYAMVLEWYWKGQTVGKRVLRLRVVDAQGLRLHPSQIVIRNVLRLVDMLPISYLVGGAACFWSRQAQRLGDIAANTVVIRSPKLREPDVQRFLPDKYNSLRAYPHLEGRLRQRVTPAEAALALRALARRNRLEPESRVALFKQMAAHFRRKVPFPGEATLDLPDEQYVQNVVDVVYRPRLKAQRSAPEKDPCHERK